MLDYGDVCLSLHLKALIQCITVHCTSSQVINELTHHLVLHEKVGCNQQNGVTLYIMDLY